MNISAFKFLSVIQASNTIANDDLKSLIDYPSLLERIRNIIAQNHADELSRSLGSESAAELLRELILKYCVQELSGKEYDVGKLAERIYLDMAGFGFLNEYLHDGTVEEINIDKYDLVEIVYNNHVKYLYGSEAFRTPQDALDTVKRFVRMGGMLLDASTPRVDSYISGGTRITASIPPVVPENCGVTASIRKQTNSKISKEQLICDGVATKDELLFLTMCLCNGVSIGIAGGTFAGKTTDEAFLLNEYILQNQDDNNRIYIIEDSRELQLIEYDKENDRPGRIMYNMTKPAPNPITMRDLVKDSMRYNPNIIVPAEVRGEEAYEAASCGQIGKTILTTLHADNAKDAYKRLLNMCNMAQTGLSEYKLMDMCVSAWPIMVFKRRLRDKSRKYMEIFEATGQINGDVIGTMLYSFDITGAERDGHGKITKVFGDHKRKGCISMRLYKRLKDNGVDDLTLFALFPELKEKVMNGVISSD